ncbi:MAG: DUF2071 domain-containing protein [Chthoniobacterales bacterium]
MWHRLQRHPISVKAFFRHSLVLTYALPRETLQPLLPPGLVLDTFGEFGFVAIALVQTESLRPAFLPRSLGHDFFLSGHRIFARFTTASGRTLRGLRILRSDTNRPLMAFFGNVFTHYGYRRATVKFTATDRLLEIQVSTSNAEADLHVLARLDAPGTSLPPGSPFPHFHQARLFAGPLPFTFDYEPQTHSIVMIEGVRQNWHPQPAEVEVRRNTFFDHAPFRGAPVVLANAFHLADVPYRWRRGVVERLPRV